MFTGCASSFRTVDGYTDTIGAWPPGTRTGRTATSGCGTRSDRNDGTECASYCGACQSWTFLLSESIMENRQKTARLALLDEDSSDSLTIFAGPSRKESVYRCCQWSFDFFLFLTAAFATSCSKADYFYMHI